MLRRTSFIRFKTWKAVIIRSAFSYKYDQQYVFFYVPQKDDEIARLRKELESRKPRGLAVNIQKSSAVNTQKSSAVEQVRKILPVKI